MAAGDITEGTQFDATANGIDIWGAEIAMEATETTAYQITTPIQHIVNVQVTVRGTAAATATTVFVTDITNNKVTVDFSHAIAGQMYLNVVVFGYK